MIYQELLNQIQENGVQLVTLGGQISPWVGAGIAALLAIVLIFLGIKVKKYKWKERKKKAGETIGEQTANDQQTTDSVQDNVDDFFEDNN